MESLTQDWHLETFRRNWLWGDNCQANICDRWGDWRCRDSNINKTKRTVDAAAKIQLIWMINQFIDNFNLLHNSRQFSTAHIFRHRPYMTDWLTDWQSYCLSCCSIWHEQARLEKWKLILGSKLHTQNFISFLLKVKIIYSDQMWLVMRRKESGAQQKINSKCNKEPETSIGQLSLRSGPTKKTINT